MWKVFESTPQSTEGVVCFITATGYLNGPGFAGMREWIRRNTSRGWIINLTPEGKQPPAHTAVFAIETEVAIGLFIRDQENDEQEPAEISYVELHGTREKKFEHLAELTLSDDEFQLTGSNWADGFVPAVDAEWAQMPALNDLFPWTAPGVKPNKTWVYAPTADILEQRWHSLVTEDDIAEKRRKFKETRDTSLEQVKKPLHGDDVEKDTRTQFHNVPWTSKPAIVRVGYRSLDRQYIIADSRLIHMPSPSLWAARIPGQFFITEQHARFSKSRAGSHLYGTHPRHELFQQQRWPRSTYLSSRWNAEHCTRFGRETFAKT